MPEALTAAVAFAGSEIGGTIGASMMMYPEMYVAAAQVLTTIAAASVGESSVRRASSWRADVYRAHLGRLEVIASTEQQ